MCRVVARFVIPISTFLMWTWVCYINVCLNVYAAQGHSQDCCSHLCLIKASAVGPFHAIAQWESPPCTWLCLSCTCVFKHICCASSIVHNCCCGVSTVLTNAFSHPLLWYILVDYKSTRLHQSLLPQLLHHPLFCTFCLWRGKYTCAWLSLFLSYMNMKVIG